MWFSYKKILGTKILAQQIFVIFRGLERKITKSINQLCIIKPSDLMESSKK